MRKFRFIGTEEQAQEYISPQPKLGVVYDEKDIIGNNSVSEWLEYNKEWDYKEWEEVVEDFIDISEQLRIIDYSPNFDEHIHINPQHYKNGKVECIDAIESAVVGKVGIEAKCVGDIIKYLWRYEDKNGIVDVKKAKWYLDKLISVLEEKNKNNES